MVGSLNAQTHVKHNKHKVEYRKINQSSSLRTTSTPPAYCPSGPVVFQAYDAINNNIGGPTGIALNCNSGPFYIDAEDNFGPEVTPCISSQYTSMDPFISSNATEFTCAN